MTTEDTQKVATLLKGARIAMLTTVVGDGTLTSRPMALQEVEFDGDLWFFSEKNSPKIATLATHPQVNVTVGSGSSWVSLAGTAVVVEDEAKKKELWNAGVGAWFPNGPEDPEVVLLKVEAASAEYWDTPGGRVASVLSFAKAKLTGERYDGGENKTVNL